MGMELLKLCEIAQKKLESATEQILSSQKQLQKISTQVQKPLYKTEPFHGKKTAARIRQLRKEMHMTQKELAERLKVTNTVICNYETNVSVPNIATMVAFANIFNVSLDYLCGRIDEKY